MEFRPARSRTHDVWHFAFCLALAGLACGAGSEEGAEAGSGGSPLDCRAVELVVGWGIGGGTDLFARSIAPAAGAALGLPVKVVNVPGANSILATEEVLDRPPDGCTVLAVTSDQVSNEAAGLTDRALVEMTPLLRAHVDVGMLHAAAGGRVRSWADVRSLGREGETVLVGGTGAGSFDEIIVAMILGTAQLHYRYIPYESGAAMHADLLGGRLHVVYEEASVMTPLIREGRARPLLVFADERVRAFPETPTARELGYPVPPGMWRGVAVHGGTPGPIAAELERAFLQAAGSDAYTAFVDRRLLDLRPGLLPGDAFRTGIEDEIDRFHRVVERARVRESLR